MDTGWPPPELLVTVSITSGTRRAPVSSISASSAATSMLPLNGCRVLGERALGNRQIDRLRAANSTLARVVSKWVLFGTTSPGLHDDAEQNPLGGAPLMRRQHVLEAEDVVDDVSKR